MEPKKARFRVYTWRSIENGRLYIPTKLELIADALYLFFLEEKEDGRYILGTEPEHEKEFAEALNIEPELFKIYSNRFIKTEPLIAGKTGHFKGYDSVDILEIPGQYLEIWPYGKLPEFVNRYDFVRGLLHDTMH